MSDREFVLSGYLHMTNDELLSLRSATSKENLIVTLYLAEYEDDSAYSPLKKVKVSAFFSGTYSSAHKVKREIFNFLTRFVSAARITRYGVREK